MSRTTAALRRSPADWAALVEACERSGLSRAAFAKRAGIHPGTFTVWASRLAPRRVKPSHGPKSSSVAAFVPVHVRATAGVVAKPLQSTVSSAPSTVEVVLCNGRRVRCDLAQIGDPRLSKMLALAEGDR